SVLTSPLTRGPVRRGPLEPRVRPVATAPPARQAPRPTPTRTDRSIRGPASLAHLAGERPGVRHRAYVPELVGVAHRADHLNPPPEYVERQGKEHLVVPVAEDGPRLAIHLVWFQRHVDPGEQGEYRGKHPGHLLGADDAPGQRWGLAAAVPGELNI